MNKVPKFRPKAVHANQRRSLLLIANLTPNAATTVPGIDTSAASPQERSKNPQNDGVDERSERQEIDPESIGYGLAPQRPFVPLTSAGLHKNLLLPHPRN